ncbi:MAG: hypothetical protein FWH27_01235 [Planctomycetaceae bacterium]|nr:hypothetical protein [Planctomycetaceae bacterium]
MIRWFLFLKHGIGEFMAARFFVLVAAVFCLGGASGCMLLNKCSWWGTSAPKPPVVLAKNASLNDVIRAVNNNNAQKHKFVATDARINIEGVPVSLNSNIAYEYPRKYRAQGKAVLSNEFDIGSNDELFWVWIKQDPSHAIYFSRHEQYESSPVRDSFQIDPYWLIESMGMTVFNPPPLEQHELVSRTADGHWKIKTTRQTAMGTYTKYTTVDGETACVLVQELINPSGRLVASAASPNHALDVTTGITYPETVDMLFSMQGQQLAMRLSMGRVQFNQSSPFLADAFNMPNYPDARPVDICGQPGTPVIQQVSATVPAATNPRLLDR